MAVKPNLVDECSNNAADESIKDEVANVKMNQETESCSANDNKEAKVGEKKKLWPLQKRMTGKKRSRKKKLKNPKVPFGCKRCGFVSTSIKNYLLHVKHIHYKTVMEKANSLSKKDIEACTQIEGPAFPFSSQDHNDTSSNLFTPMEIGCSASDSNTLHNTHLNMVEENENLEVNSSSSTTKLQPHLSGTDETTNNRLIEESETVENSEPSTSNVMMENYGSNLVTDCGNSANEESLQSLSESNNQSSPVCASAATSGTPYCASVGSNEECSSQSADKSSAPLNIVKQRSQSSKLENIVDSLKGHLLSSTSELTKNNCNVPGTPVSISPSNCISSFKPRANLDKDCNPSPTKQSTPFVQDGHNNVDVIENAYCVQEVTTAPHAQANVGTRNSPPQECITEENQKDEKSNESSSFAKFHHKLPQEAEPLKMIISSGLVTMPSASVLDAIDCNPNTWATLQRSFLQFPYPPLEQIEQLASVTKLSVQQIKSWFVSARLKHGVSWSPDEVVDAWTLIMKPDSAQDKPHQFASCSSHAAGNVVRTSTGVPNFADPLQGNRAVNPAEIAATETREDFSDISSKPHACGWVSCQCGERHEISKPQYSTLMSFPYFNEKPSAEQILEVQTITSLPFCAVTSFYIYGRFRFTFTSSASMDCTLQEPPNISLPMQSELAGLSPELFQIPAGNFMFSNPSDCGNQCFDICGNVESTSKVEMSTEQLKVLHKSFAECPHLSEAEMERIECITGMCGQTIANFFTNRRSILKRKLKSMHVGKKLLSIYDHPKHWFKNPVYSAKVHMRHNV